MTKKCARGAGTMQNSAEGRCTIPAPSRPPPPGDSIDWCITPNKAAVALRHSANLQLERKGYSVSARSQSNGFRQRYIAYIDYKSLVPGTVATGTRLQRHLLYDFFDPLQHRVRKLNVSNILRTL